MKVSIAKTLTTLLMLALFPSLHAKNRKEDAEAPNPWLTPGTPPPIAPGEKGVTVSCPDPLPQGPDKVIKLENQKESFHIRLPSNFNPNETYGAVVFISGPADTTGCPGQWLPILDERKLIYIAPQNAGNKVMVGIRDALAVTSSQLLKKYYHIDPKRVYVAGYSGGARVAGMSAFKHPELWKGTIQSCGADFYKPVPRVAVTDEEFKKSSDYGGLPDASRTQEAKANVRFVFVSGPGDFRNHYIKDIYNGGYKPEGFKALLIDVPDMRHQICNTESFSKALDFIENGKVPE